MKFYHSTPYKNLSSIAREGLRTGIEGTVFLADSKENALKFTAIRGITHIAVVEVDIPNKHKDGITESYDHAQSFFKCKAWEYNDKIPVSWLTSAWEYTLGDDSNENSN